MKKKVFVVIVIFGLTFVSITSITHYMVSKSFGRGDYPDYPTYQYYYKDYADRYPRQEVSFKSGDNILKAYIYGGKSDRLLVFAHGLGSGHEGYINQIIYFVDHGYRIFAFDGTGSGNSQGESTKGLIQSALDLEAALSYIDSSEELNKLPKYLLGHSWGGFSVAEALAYRNDIEAVASIGAYAYPIDILKNEAEKIIGFNARFVEWALNLSQVFTFGSKDAKRNAVDSINESTIPILLIHGSEDDIVPFDISIISYKNEIRNPNIETQVWPIKSKNSHHSLLRSPDSARYLEGIHEDFNKLKESYNNEIPISARQNFIDRLDKDLANQVNKDLLERILNFFELSSY